MSNEHNDKETGHTFECFKSGLFKFSMSGYETNSPYEKGCALQAIVCSRNGLVLVFEQREKMSFEGLHNAR